MLVIRPRLLITSKKRVAEPLRLKGKNKGIRDKSSQYCQEMLLESWIRLETRGITCSIWILNRVFGFLFRYQHEGRGISNDYLDTNSSYKGDLRALLDKSQQLREHFSNFILIIEPNTSTSGESPLLNHLVYFQN
jgi:hypothetical protein